MIQQLLSFHQQCPEYLGCCEQQCGLGINEHKAAVKLTPQMILFLKRCINNCSAEQTVHFTALL